MGTVLVVKPFVHHIVTHIQVLVQIFPEADPGRDVAPVRPPPLLLYQHLLKLLI